ncbi:MAG: flavodoxin family protein [Spirochaetes bacterium]|nr:flavodoxin family protein [Spirochaetota bacterium]
MVLGISASGRDGGITQEVVQTILEATKEQTKFISLHGKKINGCIACLGCAADNNCKQQDDWNEIGQAMLEAEAIVFGAPDYYGTINALGHAFLERTFAFRHRERFKLAGKIGLIAAVDGGSSSNLVPIIQMFMQSNKMAVSGSVAATGFSQCYTCGFGASCAVGNVVARHGYLEAIESHHLPPHFECQEAALQKARNAGRILGAMLSARRESR